MTRRAPTRPAVQWRRRRALVLGAAGLLAACGPAADPRLLSEAPLEVRPAPSPAPPSLPPVRFPEDEAPHNALAEWWYYTGHLYPDGSSAEYGFELVFFRGIRGDRPPGYAAHFAVTDLERGLFRYDQRQDVALNESPRPATAAGSDGAGRPPGIVAVRPASGGFDLALGNWRVRGALGHDRLDAAMPDYEIHLSLDALRPPALHLGEPPMQPGLIDFGPAGYSYYYSRTRMAVSGTLAAAGAPPVAVHGTAWMDHQWGDFLVLSGGGWDWFAANLTDGRDITMSLLRDNRGATVLAYGTLVAADGQAHHLGPSAFDVEPTGRWLSPATQIDYPSGWRVRVPGEGLDLIWRPLLLEQELDTRASTGVVYWEGAVAVEDAGSRADVGRGYVELTGYGSGR